MPDAVPGRHYFLEFVAKNGTLSRTRFLGKHARPVLLLTSEAFAHATSTTTTDSSPPGGTRAQPAELPFYLYEVAKREGANTTPAVTIGRAMTNDIVITDPGVSRIHAALFAQKDGRWTIGDASSTGTWIDGEKLQPKTHRWLRDVTQIKLGPAVHATFMTPEKLFELVARALPR